MAANENSISQTLLELVNNSGDSTLLGYNFSNNLLAIDLQDYEDRFLKITIPTLFVYGEALPADTISRTCLIELIKVSDFLNVKNDFYVPSTDFGKMMKEVSQGLQLAYGQKSSEQQWLINFKGYARMLSCLVVDLGSIRWRIDGSCADDRFI